ncbi:MAG: methylase [Bacteroidaceae bacterium]|nr:methylase [Bacteroidaceae bacterium]
MAWMRAVCGRLKSDYRYSASVVYNNFPWPGGMASASEAQQAGSAGGLARIGEDTAALERYAQNILDARALYPDSSLADLYDPLTMPAELRKAHRDNDREVLRLYGLKDNATDEQIVAKLFTMYANQLERRRPACDYC